MRDIPSGIEDTHVRPAEFLTIVEREFERVRARYAAIEAQIEPEVSAGYRREIEIVERRISFWRGEIDAFSAERGQERRRYSEDIVIGERILLDRILNLGAMVYSEPLPEDALSRVGLRSGIRIPAAHPVATPSGRTVEGRHVSALANHDVGYGRTLSLRPHQIMALNKIRGLLRMRGEQLQDAGRLPEELSRGTIVMPVGGGKTRTMVASFAAAIETGAFRLGDKFIILNHTEQIHGQNLDVVGLLGNYFRRQFGRKLRVTEYKAETRDLSGDVVVVSIPSINTGDRRGTFEAALRAALGEAGQIPMVAVDEIHHLELGKARRTKESWKMAIEMLRGISPNFFRIGFTATPTGREGPYIIKVRERDLMQAGVTPRTYLVRVKGVDLTQLKVSEDATDFDTKKLVSTLLEYPDRNRRIFEALEARGLRRETNAPSGRTALEPTLIFAADLRHARMMARGYVEYFRQAGPFMKGRNLELLGGTRGRITHGDLQEARAHYLGGRIDGLVAIVSGETPEAVRGRILELVEEGAIEAVFNVDVWFEGADLYMFTHLVGARPTFSKFKKWQERGRVNRRAPDDVASDGRLLHDGPKIIFDVEDDYHSFERYLQRYGDLMDAGGHHDVQFGDIFDAMAGVAVSDVDRIGRAIVHRDIGEAMEERDVPARPSQDVLLRPLVARLWEILEAGYSNDVHVMATDLGIPIEEMNEILQGRGWINKRWFMRRLATLLYQDRESMVELYNEERGLRDERVTDADIDILRGALAVYERLEGPIVGTIRIGGDVGYGRQEVVIAAYALRNLGHGTIGETQWRRMWHGFLLYFGVRAGRGGSNQAVARDWFDKLKRHIFDRQEWGKSTETAGGRLLLAARKGVALKFGVRLPKDTGIQGISWQNVQAALTRWLDGEVIKFGKQLSAREFYDQIKVLLKDLGMNMDEVERLIVDDVFERNQWGASTATASDKLLLAARRGVARKFGGRLPRHTGIGGVSQQTAKAPLTRWLNGEAIRFGTGIPTRDFYDQVKALLIGLDINRNEVERLIVDDIFERNRWEMDTETAGDRLLLAARKGVALKLGVRLPYDTGIEEVPRQDARAMLTKWFTGNPVRMNRSLRSQIRALLVHCGTDPAEADRLIVEAGGMAAK